MIEIAKKQFVLCVHGGLNDNIDEYLDRNVPEDYFCDLDASITHIVSGHNHIPLIKEFKAITYANSGSVGQPRDLNPQASFLMLDNGKFEIYRVNYDIDMIVKQMTDNGYKPYISEILYKGCKIGDL